MVTVRSIPRIPRIPRINLSTAAMILAGLGVTAGICPGQSQDAAEPADATPTPAPTTPTPTPESKSEIMFSFPASYQSVFESELIAFLEPLLALRELYRQYLSIRDPHPQGLEGRLPLADLANQRHVDERHEQ